MNYPDPRPGLVIRYSYLWKREQDGGKEEGSKIRPCAIILSATQDDGRKMVVAVPVTHTRPAVPDDAIEIPIPLKAALGLDEQRSWIVISETNEFLWPGPDLQPFSGQGLSSIVYGMLPPRFYAHLRERFLERARRRKLLRVLRTE